MRKKKWDPRSTACPYCGSDVGLACVVTLAPAVGPLSVEWSHRAREEAVRNG